MEVDTNLTSLHVIRIEECLRKNRDMESKLDDAVRAVQKRLDSIKRRIYDIKNQLDGPVKEFCKFNDDFVPKVEYISEWNVMDNPKRCPQNADTIAQQLQTNFPCHYEQLKKPPTDHWTPVHDSSLRSVIHKLEVKDRVKEHSKKVYQLQQTIFRNSDPIEKLKFKKDVAEFNLSALKTKTLEELVLTGKGSYNWVEVSNLMERSHTPVECKARWFHYLHPVLNTSEWTREEDVRLMDIAIRLTEQDWDSVTEQLGTGRSAYSCFTAYQSRLRGMDVLGPIERLARNQKLGEIMDSEPSWTRDDDCALAEAVTKNQSINGIAWNQVMLEFPHKSRKQLFARWSQVLDPALRGGKLTFVEQRAIVIGTRRFGLSFSKIRNELIPHRTVSQLRHFTLYRINGCKGRGRWTRFAEQILRALIEFHGPGNWVEVRSFFPFNTTMQIKRRYRRQLSLASTRHSTIYAVIKNTRAAPLSESDFETCKLLEQWESIKPLNHSGSTLPLSSLPATRPSIGHQSDFSEDEADLVSEDQPRSVPSTSEESPCDPLLEGNCGSLSNGNEEQCDSDEPLEICCKRKPGRPPSKKKKRERTEPKRTYVRTGQFKISVNENLALERNLRPKKKL